MIKFRVSNKEEFEILEQVLQIKIAKDAILKDLIDDLHLDESDIQYLNSVAIITGTFKEDNGVNIPLTVDGLEYKNGILKFFIRIEQQIETAMPVKTIAFQLMES